MEDDKEAIDSEQATQLMGELLSEEAEYALAAEWEAAGQQETQEDGPPDSSETFTGSLTLRLRESTGGSSLPKTVCASCPHAMWRELKGIGLDCFCRLMHRSTFTAEQPQQVQSCDGIDIPL